MPPAAQQGRDRAGSTQGLDLCASRNTHCSGMAGSDLGPSTLAAAGRRRRCWPHSPRRCSDQPKPSRCRTRSEPRRDLRRGKPSKPPRPHPHPTAHGRMAQVRLADAARVSCGGGSRRRIAGKAEGRRRTEPDLKVGTIDLPADSAVAGAWQGLACRDRNAVWPARENAKREKVLQEVARRRKRSGRSITTLASGATSPTSMRRWDGRLPQPSWPGRWLRVFEHLPPHGPERGLFWSRQTNRRFSPDGRGPAEGCAVPRRGPHLRRHLRRFRCAHCGSTDDAHIVAALNLQRRWDQSFRCPTAGEKRAAEASRGRKAGAAASREGSPETVGANVRSTTVSCRSGHPLPGKASGRLIAGPACGRRRLAARGAGRLPMARRPHSCLWGRPFTRGGGQGPRATGASRMEAARTTAVAVCQAQRAAGPPRQGPAHRGPGRVRNPTAVAVGFRSACPVSGFCP